MIPNIWANQSNDYNDNRAKDYISVHRNSKKTQISSIKKESSKQNSNSNKGILVETPVNNSKIGLNNSYSENPKRKAYTPIQRSDYYSYNGNTSLSSSIQTSAKRSNERRAGRSLSVQRDHSKYSNDPVILQQYKYSIEKSKSYITKSILSSYSSGKAHNSIRNGSMRRQCGNKSQVAAKEYVTTGCARHKI